jgi:hypothetical protein
MCPSKEKSFFGTVFKVSDTCCISVGALRMSNARTCLNLGVLLINRFFCCVFFLFPAMVLIQSPLLFSIILIISSYLFFGEGGLGRVL